MMRRARAVLLLLSLATISALPADPNRIVGGSVTTIEQYPFMVAMLASTDFVWYQQICGGTIINNRSVLTAAHCFDVAPLEWQWRCRVGSTFANSGGDVLSTTNIFRHPNYNHWSMDNDIAVLRILGSFTFSNSVRVAFIAGPNYNVADNSVVWATGWGRTCTGCESSETLLHVQMWAVNFDVCRQRYSEIGYSLTDNMMCSGWLDVGGRDQCQGDSGGPLIHNGVVVGVCSWGEQCALARFPGVNARVSAASQWITNNA